MTLNWERWDAMKASLDYCCVRICELEHAGVEGRAELEELVEYGMRTAARMLFLPDAPPLSTARFRARWQDGCAAVEKSRERIARARMAHVARGDALGWTAGSN